MEFINITKSVSDISDLVIIGDKKSKFKNYNFNQEELNYISKKIKDKKDLIVINQYKRIIILSLIKKEKKKKEYEIIEKVRKAACQVHQVINSNKIVKITIIHNENDTKQLLAFSEGLALVNYQFLKYLKDNEEKKYSLQEVKLYGNLDKIDISYLNNLVKAVYYTRDLVNEPLSYLNAIKLSEEIKKLGEEAGFKVEVFNKKKIESLKFGGLLAVNKGSIDPPTFSILEWKPENAINKRPVVLIGKGIVFDTGGLSLKPTPNSMDEMKSDMAGAAAVAGTFYAIAKNKIPVYVVGLIPATDNRPDGNAYVPGDVIKMYNGLTVEVLNTDAEGRMILADALSYAQKYNPELVIDIATLTGSAEMTVGSHAIVAMGNASEKVFNKIKQSGYNVYERLVELPFWDEYGEMLKSEIADLKNIGGKVAGAITGGKFLENFTNYPYIHLDIAGVSFLSSSDGYRPKGGSGTGVRLLYDFIKNY